MKDKQALMDKAIARWIFDNYFAMKKLSEVVQKTVQPPPKPPKVYEYSQHNGRLVIVVKQHA